MVLNGTSAPVYARRAEVNWFSMARSASRLCPTSAISTAESRSSRALLRPDHAHRGQERLRLTDDERAAIRPSKLVDAEVPRRSRPSGPSVPKFNVSALTCSGSEPSVEWGAPSAAEEHLHAHLPRAGAPARSLRRADGCRFHYNTHTVGGNRHDYRQVGAAATRVLAEIVDADEYEDFVREQVFLARGGRRRRPCAGHRTGISARPSGIRRGCRPPS